MKKPLLGIAIGGTLGLFDGLSAWAYPEARAMMAAIVTGSVVKGVVTGLGAGLIARWRRSTVLGIAAGAMVGTILSAMSAVGQPEHYWAIVVPGMLLGVIAGYGTQRYGSPGPSAAMKPPVFAIAFVLLASAAPESATRHMSSTVTEHRRPLDDPFWRRKCCRVSPPKSAGILMLKDAFILSSSIEVLGRCAAIVILTNIRYQVGGVRPWRTKSGVSIRHAGMFGCAVHLMVTTLAWLRYPF